VTGWWRNQKYLQSCSVWVGPVTGGDGQVKMERIRPARARGPRKNDYFISFSGLVWDVVRFVSGGRVGVLVFFLSCVCYYRESVGQSVKSVSQSVGKLSRIVLRGLT